MESEFKACVCDRYTAAELIELLATDVEVVYDLLVGEPEIELLMEDMEWIKLDE